ncbi:MAG: pentapeptide repeat-containing protein [Pseudomonadota bacterium]
MSEPIVHQNPFYELLRSENIDEFNRRKKMGEVAAEHLRGGNFRGLDLRNLDTDGLDLSDAYFRAADLRGIDFRTCNLEGASFCQAYISGCYFPTALSSEEIRLSIEKGIRVRYST